MFFKNFPIILIFPGNFLELRKIFKLSSYWNNLQNFLKFSKNFGIFPQNLFIIFTTSFVNIFIVLNNVAAAIIKGNHTNCAQFANSNRLNWLFSRLGSQASSEGTGMLDVLHCVLIDSPEALNMMRVSLNIMWSSCKFSVTSSGRI